MKKVLNWAFEITPSMQSKINTIKSKKFCTQTDIDWFQNKLKERDEDLKQGKTPQSFSSLIDTFNYRVITNRRQHNEALK